MNATLAAKLPLSVSPDTMDSPHTKTHLLLQAHFSRAQLPIADYGTDTKSVLDQALRILQVGNTKQLGGATYMYLKVAIFSSGRGEFHKCLRWDSNP